MQKLIYYILDVFTDEKFKGNPLSVVWCEDELDLHQYYAIAREFGYSETSFVNYSSADKAFKVRSFTPGDFEVAGAGHNLLGAVCLAVLKEWNIFREQEKGEQWVIMKEQKIPLHVTIEKGLPFVALKQQPAVVSNKTLLKEASEKYGFEGSYLFTTGNKSGHYLAETRFFNPGIGIDEDASTGTAAGPLAGYLYSLNHIVADQEYDILQGVEVGHPSSIRVKVSAEGVWVSGSSVIVMEGILYI